MEDLLICYVNKVRDYYFVRFQTFKLTIFNRKKLTE